MRALLEKKSSVTATQAKKRLKRVPSLELRGELIIDFDTMELFETGGQGKVYKARGTFMRDGVQETRYFALKQMKDAQYQYLMEQKISAGHASTSDFNIIMTIEIQMHKGTLYEIMPWCTTTLEHEKAAILSLKETDTFAYYTKILAILHDTLIALNYLHGTLCIIHGDINARNIGVHERGHYCLIDKGSAMDVGSKPELSTAVGTLYYIHPACCCSLDERLMTQPFNDFYALGQMLGLLLNPLRTDVIEGDDCAAFSYLLKKGKAYEEGQRTDFRAYPIPPLIDADRTKNTVAEIVGRMEQNLTSMDYTRQPSIHEFRHCVHMMRTMLAKGRLCMEEEDYNFWKPSLTENGFFKSEPESHKAGIDKESMVDSAASCSVFKG